MTDQPAQAAQAVVDVPARRVYGIVLDDELYLFERALHAEKLAYLHRARFPRALGAVKLYDAAAAAQLLEQMHAQLHPRPAAPAAT